MTEERQATTEKLRIYWLDNLRTFMIFLVIVIHAGLVYESSGISAFFWIVDDPATNDLSGILNLIIDIFVMSTIFFISGFFAPLSVKSKQGFEFLKSKFKRLIVPWFIAVLTLIPLYKIIFLYSRNLPQEDWTTYFHWSNGIWNQNWLWFLPVLFLFNALYLFLPKTKIKVPNISLKSAIWVVVLASLCYSICIDVLGLQGWTKTILMDFQNERIFIYFMIFLLGSLCYKLKTFESERKSKRLCVLLASTAWIPVMLYLALVIHSLINPGSYILSGFVDLLLIRGSFLLSLMCLMYLAINTFMLYLNKPGRVGRELNANSYNVYIIHVVVMGGFALAMLDTAIPSVLKHLILVVSTYVASNVIISLYRRINVSLMKESPGTVDRRLTHREI
jgi:surface polysaccharide O-acyltransferase-like enzyme